MSSEIGILVTSLWKLSHGIALPPPDFGVSLYAIFYFILQWRE